MHAMHLGVKQHACCRSHICRGPHYHWELCHDISNPACAYKLCETSKLVIMSGT